MKTSITYYIAHVRRQTANTGRELYTRARAEIVSEEICCPSLMLAGLASRAISAKFPRPRRRLRHCKMLYDAYGLRGATPTILMLMLTIHLPIEQPLLAIATTYYSHFSISRDFAYRKQCP